MTIPVTNRELIEQQQTQIAELKAELRQVSNLLTAVFDSKEDLWKFAFSLESKVENIEREMPRDC